MQAALIDAGHQVRVATVPDPEPGPAEVVVQVAAAGICGTDLHILHGEYPSNLPLVPGHEFAGTVAAVGQGVPSDLLGQPVAVDPNIPCNSCRYCREGRVQLCTDYRAIGVTQAGAAAASVVVPAALCFPLPQGTDLQLAALLEPIACAVHGIDLIGADIGRRVAIFGGGTMGLAMLQLALLAGAASVDVIERAAFKHEAALGLGAQSAVLSAEELDHTWDVVIDATGNPAAITEGIARTGRGGTFLQFGVSSPQATVPINPYRIYDDEIRILGSVCPGNAFQRACDLLGRLHLDPLVSHRVSLTDYPAALEAFASGTTKKVLVIPEDA
ncbi:MAG: alcohol dehydrogenase catalytic domain-containing protein [Beutenbergiaceae bacterium]